MTGVAEVGVNHGGIFITPLRVFKRGQYKLFCVKRGKHCGMTGVGRRMSVMGVGQVRYRWRVPQINKSPPLTRKISPVLVI